MNLSALFGFLKAFVSDRDANFKGNSLKDFCKQIGVSLDVSLAYHPQVDGEAKVVNKCSEAYLRWFVTHK
jgi:hypothetical protein